VIEHERSYRGFNLFCEEDQRLMQVLARGEFNIRGLQNRTLRDHLPDKRGGQVSRPLKRLRLHGFIKKAGRTYRNLTHFRVALAKLLSHLSAITSKTGYFGCFTVLTPNQEKNQSIRNLLKKLSHVICERLV